MHELSIASYLLDAVTEQARQVGANRVVAINLVVGARAGVVDDALRFSFELLAPDTLAEGAHINVRRTAMRFHCDECNDEYTPGGIDFRCPDCARVGQVTDDGSQLLIESIEIDT